MTNDQILLLELLQIVFGDRKTLSFPPKENDWKSTLSLSIKQGVVGIVFMGIEKLSKNIIPSRAIVLEWLCQVQGLKTSYLRHQSCIRALSKLFNEKHIPMMVLKGYGLSLNYPNAFVRPCGDIDIYCFGQHSNADEIIRNLGVIIDSSNPHHSQFVYNNFLIENHRTFLDQDNHKSNKRIEQVIHNIIDEESGVEIEENIFIPSPTVNAIYLIRHAGEHFTSCEITIRHLLDISTFFQANHHLINWDVVIKVLNDEKMIDFYNGLSTICCYYLGFSDDLFYGYQVKLGLAQRILQDIFEIKKTLPMASQKIHGLNKYKYAFNKTVRWWNNRWKYKIVYNESLFESFLTLAINRIRH